MSNVSREPGIRLALPIIKGFEGFRSKAYKDVAGVWTIGYGTTRFAGHIKVTSGDRISEEYAEELLYEDVRKFANALDDVLRIPVTPHQYAALLSFVYNIGPYAFRKSTLLRKLNLGDFAGAAKEFSRWVHAGGKKVKGLVRRREAERTLFLTKTA